MDEIRNCPFCGGEADVRENYNTKQEKYYFFCRCEGCGAIGKKFISRTTWDDHCMDLAIAAWNSRV